MGGIALPDLPRFKSFHEWYRLLGPEVDGRVVRHRVPILRFHPYEAFVERVWTPAHVRRVHRNGAVLHVTTNLLAYAALARPTPPVVVTCHHVLTCGERDFGWPDYRFPDLERRHNEGLSIADHVVASSDHTRTDVIRGLGIHPDRVRTIPVGVDLARYRPRDVPAARRTSLGFFPAPASNLLYVGTEAPRKNLPTLFRALERLRRERDVRLVKIGPPRPPHRRELERLARELGLEGAIRWVDAVREEDLPDYYAAADAFVFPTRFEGFGMPVLEAMACGCPVVTCDVASVPEVAGPAALYSRPDDLDALVENVRRVLDEPHLREQLRRDGLARAATMPWERTAREHERLYRELLET